MKKLLPDKDQLKFINHGNGPAICVAGPGSGKTFTIAHRINHLITNSNVSATNILVITFTKTAALDMKKRFISLFGDLGYLVSFQTFHSAYYSFLREFSSERLQIISAEDSYKIITKLCGREYEPEDFISLISKVKSDKICESVLTPFEASIYKEYNDYLHDRHLIDFDDILILSEKLLLANPYALSCIRQKYTHILVDEFQDINPIQYRILKMIAAPLNNIFAVGDDDQSIYGFRGASKASMRNFLRDFKDAKFYELKTNYRSKYGIQFFSDKVIAKNTERLKTTRYNKLPDGDDKSVKLLFPEGRDEEYSLVREMIAKDLAEGSTVAVLLRTNKDISEYGNILKEFLNGSGKESRLAQTIAKDIYAYLHFTLYKDRDSLLTVLDSPDKVVPRSIFNDGIVDFGKILSTPLRTFIKDSVNQYKRMFEFLSNCNPFSFYIYVLNVTGYKEDLNKRLSKSEKEEASMAFKSLEELAKKSRDLETFLKGLEQKIIDLTPNVKKTNSKLKLLTFHASKGLEFDKVYIPDIVEGKIPGRQSLSEDTMEEERRLFYVAMTRAINNLNLFVPIKKGSAETLPSRFLDDLLHFVEIKVI